MNRRAAASGMILLLLVAALIATELARPQSPFEISGDATRGSRGGTRSSSPTVAQPAILLERPPTCVDGLRNGLETGVDCGGSVCPNCPNGLSCVSGSDCASTNCVNNLCQVLPTCADGMRNGQETDVDCGGDVCIAQGLLCGSGNLCLENRDCKGAHCRNGLCEASDTCTDGIKNGGETGVDCGGSGSGFGKCTRCADGIACVQNADCISSRCVSGVCQALSTCTDGLKNGAETAVDCGGSTCPTCANSAACLSSSDCSSASCVNGVCQALPTCTDGLKNAQETDVDCGGPTCSKCAMDKVCAADTDCSTNKCYSGKCADSKVTLPCNRNQCGGTGVYLASGACSAPAQTIYPAQSCNCNGVTNQCTNQCSSGGCASGQTCKNNQCVTQKQGYCGSCESNAGCQSGYCYYGSCINRGDEIGNWGNFNYCGEGESCVTWSKPVRLERASFACGNSPQGGWTAYYRGNRFDSASYQCQPWPNNMFYINWGAPYMGWVDKVVSYGAASRQGGFNPSSGFQSPCSRMTDYFTSG